MKTKFIFLIAFIAGLLVISSAQAQTFDSRDFLKGTNLFLAPQSTNTYGTTNVYNYELTNNASWDGNATTNATWTKDVDLFCDRDGTTPSNAGIAVHLIGLDNVQATNTILIQIRGIPRGRGIGNFGSSGIVGMASTAPQNWFTFAVTANGTNDVMVSTNTPAGFLQGCGQARLYQVGSATPGTGGTNIVIKSISYNGFTP